MRHNKKNNHLGRTSSHRKAMLSNMAVSLIMHKRITTTVAKAKELRVYVEPLITRSKNDTTHSRRMVFAHLKDKNAVAELFRDVAVKVGDRPGGYTRILKTGTRLGDSAQMCIIELVDYNETYVPEAKTEKPQAKRTRRGGASKAVETKETTATTDTKVEKAKEAEETKKVEDVVVPEEQVEEEPKAEDVSEENKTEDSKEEAE